MLNNNKFEGFVLDKNDNKYLIVNYKNKYKIKAVSYNKLNIEPGDYIIFNGETQKLLNVQEGILKSQNINAYVYIKDNYIKTYRNFNILMLPYKIRYKINSALLNIDKKGGSFICGLVSGSTAAMDPSDINNFQELGISHVLAISGFNLGIIYYFINRLTKKLKAQTRYIVTLLVCFIYTLFGGFQPSITRAFLMIAIVIFSKLIKRTSDSLNSIVLAAFIMLTYNSFYLFNIGFLLSYLGAIGLIVFKDDIKDKLPDKTNRINDELSVCLAAFIATFPVILYYKGYISVLTLLINLIISPIITVLTIFSFIFTSIYALFGIKYILYPLTFSGNVFMTIINNAANININLYFGRPFKIFFFIYVVYILYIFDYIKIAFFNKHNKFIKCCLALILILILIIYYPALKVNFLNVGQGDCIFIETPQRHTILIDTGPIKGDYIAARSKVLPYINRCGYNKIDLLIISHFHEDHAGGLDYLLENINIDKIISFENPDNIKHNFKLTKVSRGDKIIIDDLVFHILYPDKNISVQSDGSDDSKNEECLIFDAYYKGFTMLFTGDADKDMIDKLHGNYDILKVAHHGSINSLSDKMLESSVISNAIISVGKNNYGHPSGRLIQDFKKRMINIYRTDINGDIIITTLGKEYDISTEVN